MTRLHRRAIVGIAAVMLASACRGHTEAVSPDASTTIEPITVDHVALEIPLAPPPTIDIPIAAPPELEGVRTVVRPDQPCTLEATVENDTLGFAQNSSVISPAGEALAREFVALLLTANKGRPPKQIEIHGYASAEGDEIYNLGLSQARADAIKTLLTTIPELASATVTSTGHGEADPVGDNTSEDGRRQNRRVDTTFTFPGCE